MPIQALTRKIDDLREKLAHESGDPRELHDEVCRLVEDLGGFEGDVPADLREAVEALEAEIVEDFYDNLPV
jgi:tagatose-1,6-bisphosphate aldolase non-catalytic subunit AgaZ/GatZ